MRFKKNDVVLYQSYLIWGIGIDYRIEFTWEIGVYSQSINYGSRMPILHIVEFGYGANDIYSDGIFNMFTKIGEL